MGQETYQNADDLARTWRSADYGGLGVVKEMAAVPTSCMPDLIRPVLRHAMYTYCTHRQQVHQTFSGMRSVTERGWCVAWQR